MGAWTLDKIILGMSGLHQPFPWNGAAFLERQILCPVEGKPPYKVAPEQPVIERATAKLPANGTECSDPEIGSPCIPRGKDGIK